MFVVPTPAILLASAPSSKFNILWLSTAFDTIRFAAPIHNVPLFVKSTSVTLLFASTTPSVIVNEFCVTDPLNTVVPLLTSISPAPVIPLPNDIAPSRFIVPEFTTSVALPVNDTPVKFNVDIFVIAVVNPVIDETFSIFNV